TNPVMSLVDIAAVAEITRRRGIRLVVDNTFMSSYFQRPLELGADVVVHSTTKYLNGHSDSVGGVVVLDDEEEARQMAFIQNAAGAILAPMDAFLIMRGTMTHASVPEVERNRLGITDGLVRISVGIEDVEDIIGDLDQALGKI